MEPKEQNEKKTKVKVHPKDLQKSLSVEAENVEEVDEGQKVIQVIKKLKSGVQQKTPLQITLLEIYSFPIELTLLVDDYFKVQPLEDYQAFLIKDCPLLLERRWKSHKDSRDTPFIHPEGLLNLWKLPLKTEFCALHVLLYFLKEKTTFLIKLGRHHIYGTETYGFALHNLLCEAKGDKNQEYRQQLSRALLQLPCTLDDPSMFPAKTFIMVISLLAGENNFYSFSRVDHKYLFAHLFSRPLEDIAQRYLDPTLASCASWQSVAVTIQKDLFFVISDSDCNDRDYATLCSATRSGNFEDRRKKALAIFSV